MRKILGVKEVKFLKKRGVFSYWNKGPKFGATGHHVVYYIPVLIKTNRSFSSSYRKFCTIFIQGFLEFLKRIILLSKMNNKLSWNKINMSDV